MIIFDTLILLQVSLSTRGIEGGSSRVGLVGRAAVMGVEVLVLNYRVR